MTVVKIIVFLDLNEKSYLSFGHYLTKKLIHSAIKFTISHNQSNVRVHGVCFPV